jgi:hypothetical protein
MSQAPLPSRIDLMSALLSAHSIFFVSFHSQDLLPFGHLCKTPVREVFSGERGEGRGVGEWGGMT